MSLFWGWRGRKLPLKVNRFLPSIFLTGSNEKAFRGRNRTCLGQITGQTTCSPHNLLQQSPRTCGVVKAVMIKHVSGWFAFGSGGVSWSRAEGRRTEELILRAEIDILKQRLTRRVLQREKWTASTEMSFSLEAAQINFDIHFIFLLSKVTWFSSVNICRKTILRAEYRSTRF